MPSPRNRRSAPPLLILLCAALLAMPFARSAPVKAAPVASATLPLESFGYRPSGVNAAVRAGFASVTIDYIDPEHLLLTYSARKLMKRLQDQQETDDDHTVRALVLHLPDGKVVRETEWRMHDRATYLWPLGHGRFLLRERGNLYALNPLGNVDPEHLGRQLLYQSSRELVEVQVSPGSDLLMLQSVPPHRVGDDPDEQRDTAVSIDFYRLLVNENESMRLVSRGKAVAKRAFSLAFTSFGVLQTVREDRTHWGFDFHAYDGRKIDLAGFTSTCRPESIFVSDTEFFAFGCRGGDDRRLMGGFNLLGEAQWVFTVDDPPVWLSVQTSPEAGRFAVRNTLTNSPVQPGDRLGGEDIRAQEVRVYGGRQGDELLRVVCSPSQRPPGNFALSPDGEQLAVLRGTSIEIYKLSPPTAADRKLVDREQGALTDLRPAASRNVAAALSGGNDDTREDTKEDTTKEDTRNQ